MERVEYFDPEHSIILYKQYKLHKHTENTNGIIRWRCQSCKSISVTIDKEGFIVRTPANDSNHRVNLCKKLSPVQILYREMVQMLQANYDPNLVAEALPSEETARVTCSTNKSKSSKKDLKSSLSLEISDELKLIQISNQQQLFLRFDNYDKKGDRIVIFLSDTAIEILQKAEEYHLDGKFKNSPKMFYQILTLHAVIQNQTFPCAYIFLEKK
ncbi:unnamed protein product [Brachionus calyciflorus]|uniref:FLYWCH-type domain-containing protein n=1 Tax=Brachionus calyciflorus TaxID=104777 RepID=A0A813Z3K7_9BILA|nr:unnamed protein product [Brachionus calyciflorus]